MTKLLGAWVGVLVVAAALGAAEPPSTLRPDHAAFLADAQLLLSSAEREAFVALGRDYQRERFISRFWQVRDPFPETARNEFRDAWEARVAAARARYGDLTDGRAYILLVNGEPAGIERPQCRTLLKPIEIWSYDGIPALRGEFTLLFVQPQGNLRGKYRLWQKTEGLASLLEWASPVGLEVQESARRIVNECPSGSDLLGAVATSLDWDRVESKLPLLPKPNPEWLKAFANRSTELPADALPLDATLEVRFPSRHQSRTVIEAVVAVEQSAATAGPKGGFGFVVDGEVLLQGELFESFRYRFDLPAPPTGVAATGASATLPMVIERYLRPGAYALILRVEDLHGHRFFRTERPLEVPRVEGSAPPVLVAAAATATALAAAAPAAQSATLGEQTLKLYAPQNELKTGRVRVEATTEGEGIVAVAFVLNGKPVLTKSRPPWSVELDLGRAPRTHQLRAVALDATGRELASDELLLNAGPHSFRVRLVQPQRGQRYVGGLRAEAEVALPLGETLDRVEFFLNEERIATLYQPPFVQPMSLAAGGQSITYVRAVAYLPDGNTAEAVTFVNAPEYATEVKVDLVELFATVVDRRGRPVEGLERSVFTVLEDDKPQQILRFELVHDLPIRAAVVLDTSASMAEELHDATNAALRFFEEVLTAKDRAAIITFADKPALVSPFTNNREVLAGGVSSLVADGETALWDSIVYTLHYFSGIRGKRAMVLLSDGEDVSSKYEFSEALDFARRTGVAIYAIGLGLPQKAVDARAKMSRLAEETGGRSFSIESVGELERVYREIEEELRSQYLIAYQSLQDEPTRYRAVAVKVARPGVEAKTIRGYYP